MNISVLLQNQNEMNKERGNEKYFFGGFWKKCCKKRILNWAFNLGQLVRAKSIKIFNLKNWSGTIYAFDL